MPRVSFITAARDAEATIGAALDSVVAQTFSDWEAIVVDDGSRDSTAERANALDDSRIRVLRLETSRGRGAARNVALELARGEFVAIQDADDISHPRRLETLLALAAADAGLGVVSGQHAAFSVSGKYGVGMRWPTGDAEIRAALLRGEMSICHPGSLIRRQLLLDLGGYDETCIRAQDLNLFIRAVPFTRFAASERIVLYYRHPRIVTPARWLENARFSRLAVERAGVRPRRGRLPHLAESAVAYVRYALREAVVPRAAVAGPVAHEEAPVTPWKR